MTHDQETYTRNGHKKLASANFLRQILMQVIVDLLESERRSIRYKKLVEEKKLAQESLSDVQVSCASFSRVCHVY